MRARKEWLEWFRVDRDLADHPKLYALAEAGGCNLDEALGRLIRFWSWVARFAPRGTCTQHELDCARKLGHGVDALMASAFIERTNSDGFRIRNWWDFNGKAIKERARKRRGSGAETPRKVSANSEPTVRDGTVRNIESESETESKALARSDEHPAENNGNPSDAERAAALVRGIASAFGGPNRRGPPPKQDALDVDALWPTLKPLGSERSRAAIQAFVLLWKRGLCYQPLYAEFARIYADRCDSIRNPFAYFSPGSQGFQDMKANLAATLSERDHEAIRKAESEWSVHA